MNYFIKRGDQEYGPYSLTALQQYISQGNISKDDLARSEAMTDWVPVHTILGNVPIPTAATFGTPVLPTADLGPPPPRLHWGWVVGLGIVTFGIFWIIWLFVQAVWLRRVQPKSHALFYLVGYVAVSFTSGALNTEVADPILRIVGVVLYLVAIFSMRSSIEDYYSSINPAGLSLSGVMTFFFNAAYFQYHLKEIREVLDNQRAAAAVGSGI